MADALARATAEPQLAANQQTGLRLACNLCKQNLRSWLQSNSSAVLDRFGPCCSSTNKSVRLAFATLLLNLAVLLGTSGSIGVDTQAQVSLYCSDDDRRKLCHAHLEQSSLQNCHDAACCNAALSPDLSINSCWLQALSALLELSSVTPPQEADTVAR